MQYLYVLVVGENEFSQAPSGGWPIRDSVSETNSIKAGSPKRRVGILMLMVLAGLLLAVVKLADIQVIDAEKNIELVKKHIRTEDLIGHRGAILDTQFSPLAQSTDMGQIAVNPKLVLEVERTARLLAPVLGHSEKWLRERLTKPFKEDVLLSPLVELTVVEEVKSLKLPGLIFRIVQGRQHPSGNIASGLIGRVNPEQEPYSGLEVQFNDVLEGESGTSKSYRSQGVKRIDLPNGQLDYRAEKSGDDLVLALHAPTQWLTEKVLKDAVEKSGAKKGTVVVMEVETGNVLAVAGVVRDSLSNKVENANYLMAYVDTYEPGSVNKPFTVAAALETNRISADQVFDVPQTYLFSDKLFREPYFSSTGSLSVPEILAKSSNIGTIQIAEALGRDLLHQYLSRLGFGSYSGESDVQSFPAESRGILRHPRDWDGTGLATIAFGQGISVTSIQLAAAYNTIANGGVYLTPRLVRGTLGSNGFEPEEFVVGKRVLSAETATEIQKMLTGVVLNGTGKRAAVNGYAVAGKTGTAQKTRTGGFGYSDYAYTSTFAGFVPADSPAITIVVTLDEPVEYMAGLVAAPIFSDIARQVLQTQRIPPSDIG
jgi:cell division protein FtsI (penicillin-binding protein 3)